MTQPDGFDLLEDAFQDARAQPVPVPQALSARIAADAAAHLPRAALWRRALRALGGPAGVGGLVTATAAGLWLGIAPPLDVLDPLVLAGIQDSAAIEDVTGLSAAGWYADEG